MMLSERIVGNLRRKAFGLAGQLVGKGKPAYELLHDLTGMESVSGLSADFWSGLCDQLQDIKDRRARDQNAPGCTPRQWRYIQDLREKVGMDETHFRNFLKKQLKIDSPRFLTVAKARGVIGALLRMNQRARREQTEQTEEASHAVV